MSAQGKPINGECKDPAGAKEQDTVFQGSSEARLGALRSQIQDLAHDVNTRKAKLAAALGGSVFLILLSAGATYDLFRGNLAPWMMLGLDRQILTWIAGATGLASIIMLILGLVKLLPDSNQREARLAELEREYEDLLE